MFNVFVYALDAYSWRHYTINTLDNLYAEGNYISITTIDRKKHVFIRATVIVEEE
jgi:hypothetical protein